MPPNKHEKKIKTSTISERATVASGSPSWLPRFRSPFAEHGERGDPRPEGEAPTKPAAAAAFRP